ncbi:hypothetical protein niasHT_019052 [Heterodera trifolii]|uniref:Uncharacterized protein n=1 Tax=Heterodera trifolii TaxID=157864 RepID=A0ABD2LAR4_9BILA
MSQMTIRPQIRPPPPQFVANRPFVAFLVNHSQTVNEQGTEAAAATAVLIMAGSFIRPPLPQFVVDRAFVAFLVNHSQTLNEKGTEASDATAVIVGEEASGPIEPEPALFIANRPFLVALTSAGNKIHPDARGEKDRGGNSPTKFTNEEGSEAAGATAVVMMTRTALVTRPKSEFVADRPFYFTIRHPRRASRSGDDAESRHRVCFGEQGGTPTGKPYYRNDPEKYSLKDWMDWLGANGREREKLMMG